MPTTPLERLWRAAESVVEAQGHCLCNMREAPCDQCWQACNDSDFLHRLHAMVEQRNGPAVLKYLGLADAG